MLDWAQWFWKSDYVLDLVVCHIIKYCVMRSAALVKVEVKLPHYAMRVPRGNSYEIWCFGAEDRADTTLQNIGNHL
jgi:hypothetical protein